MVRTIKSFDDVRVDIVEALKRAYIHSGFIPRPRSAAVNKKKPNAAGSDGQKKHPEDNSHSDYQPPSGDDPIEVQEKLIDMTVKAQDVLYKADTVFPFRLFPDTITIDREKLTVATRYFFRIATIISVPLNSILSAEADVGPFFGSVHLTSKYFVRNAYAVRFLWRKDALRIQHLLQGVIIANEKEVDITDINKEDLLILLTDLGQGVTD